ncbi:Non-canonical purine NTP pyrophosphatase [compost metagenome]
MEASGQVEGWIIAEPRGLGGFGYDPLFYLPAFEKTMGELTVDEKQSISHRGRALEQLLKKIEK